MQIRRIRRTCQLVAACVALLGVTARAADITLEEVLSRASQLPQRLHSYDFKLEFVAEESESGRPPTKNAARYRQAGNEFRVESDATPPPGIVVDPIAQRTVFAYNGEKYQWFIAGREALSFSSQCRHPNLYWLPNPVVVPYSWLGGPLTNWSTVKDAQTWIERFASARVDGIRPVDGADCVLVSMPLAHAPNGRVEVYFAINQHYYPIKVVEYKEEAPAATIEVKRLANLQAADGPIVFPLLVESRVEAPSAVQIRWEVSEASIVTNQPLDEDLFSLSPSIAKTVIDYDRELKNVIQPGTAPPGAVAAAAPAVSPRGWRVPVLFANVALVALVGLWVAYRRTAHRRAAAGG